MKKYKLNLCVATLYSDHEELQASFSDICERCGLFEHSEIEVDLSVWYGEPDDYDDLWGNLDAILDNWHLPAKIEIHQLGAGSDVLMSPLWTDEDELAHDGEVEVKLCKITVAEFEAKMAEGVSNG